MRGSWVKPFLFVLVSILVLPPVVSAQGRKLKKIERPPETRREPAVTDLPTPQQCEQVVRIIAAAYGDVEIEEHLHRDFPYRSEFLDALKRTSLSATNVELYVEAVENTSFTPVEEIRDAQQGPIFITDCIADVRTRVTFDDPQTGERVTRDPGRGQWRIRFSRPAGGAR
jgi:hypothetical protein